MACVICGHSGCIGKYLLHPKEMQFISQIKKRELAEDSSVKFKELHVYK